MNDVLQRIQSLMDERGWTIYKLAKVSGVPYSSLSSIFKLNNQPTIGTLEKICAGFHITLSEFFSDRPPYREITDSYSDDEKALIENYQKLSSKNKALMRDFMNLLVNQE